MRAERKEQKLAGDAGGGQGGQRRNDPRGMTTASPSAPGSASMQPPPPEMQGPRRVIMELAQEEVLRAVYSDRQLQEVMVQFWMNHFNIFAPKGADKIGRASCREREKRE